jgi:phage-related protein/predicted XRE-type DNA-binding protein
VRRVPAADEKPLHWVGSSKRDFLSFPAAVKEDMGNALGIAQFGGTAPTAKPWKGLGPGVLEVVESHYGNAYRAVYTVRFEKAVYVLHAFQKKSPSGIRTAKRDVDLVAERLKTAERVTRNTMASKNAEGKKAVTRGTGNVFADLGFPDAVERKAKLRLAYALNQVLAGRRLSQADAAKVLGVTQPKVSALRHYKLAGFSVERLMNLLTALDQDVEIVIRRKPRSRRTGRISVVAA